MAFTPERTAAFQQAQIGLESTLGTQVAATIKLQSFSIIPRAAVVTKKFVPKGRIVPTLIPIGKDYTTARVESDAPSYEEIGYFLKSAMSGDAAPIIVGDAATTAVQGLSCEVGDGGATDVKFAMGIVNGFTFRVTQEDVSFSGEMFGKQLTVAARTGALTDAAVTPIQPSEAVLVIDGSTVAKWLEIVLESTGRWQMVWFAGALYSIVEVVPTLRATLKVEADATGMGYLTSWFRGGNATKTLSLTCTSGTKVLKFEAGVKINEPQEFSDEDGVYALQYDLQMVKGAAPLSAAFKATLPT